MEQPMEHPIVTLSVNSVAATYDLAHDAAHAHRATAKSALSGNIINRFCHLHQSLQDLMDKVDLQRTLGHRTGACFQRCVGMDAINAVFIVTYEIDKQYNTDYHQRFRRYMLKVEEADWTIDGCMTDVKGNRKKAPVRANGPRPVCEGYRKERGWRRDKGGEGPSDRGHKLPRAPGDAHRSHATGR